MFYCISIISKSFKLLLTGILKLALAMSNTLWISSLSNNNDCTYFTIWSSLSVLNIIFRVSTMLKYWSGCFFILMYWDTSDFTQRHTSFSFGNSPVVPYARALMSIVVLPWCCLLLLSVILFTSVLPFIQSLASLYKLIINFFSLACFFWNSLSSLTLLSMSSWFSRWSSLQSTLRIQPSSLTTWSLVDFAWLGDLLRLLNYRCCWVSRVLKSDLCLLDWYLFSSYSKWLILACMCWKWSYNIFSS